MDKNSILEFYKNRKCFRCSERAFKRWSTAINSSGGTSTELSEYLSHHQRLTDDGRVALVRNDYLPKPEILTGIGPGSVRIPKVRSRDCEAITFRSALVPHLSQKTRSLEATLPWQ